MKEELNKIIDQVIDKQRINGLSPESRKGLASLKIAFESSLNRIDQILDNDDDDHSALGYIVRDWNNDPYDRNGVIVNIMKNLSVDLEKIRKENDGND